MQEKIENPSVSLRTLALVIQLVQNEIDKYQDIVNKENVGKDDYIWLSDLDLAANDLKCAYRSYIEKNNIINFPTYEHLVRPKKTE